MYSRENNRIRLTSASAVRTLKPRSDTSQSTLLPPVRPGDTVGIIAPAGPPLHQQDLDAGISALKACGFRVLQARNQYPAYGFLAGPDNVRLAELNSMIGRPDVRALFCVRGGYGSLRLLPGIDFETLSRYPKTIVGYSDITALQLAILCKTGLGSLSAGMVAVDWREPDPAWVQPVLDLLSGSVPGRLRGPRGESLQPVRPGRVEGRLIGGNLTTIVRLVGTPFLPSMEGAILFLEDVGEEPYRIDGLLAQLELSGVLDSVGGLIIGAFTEIPSRPDRPSASIDEVLMDYVSRMEVPVARNLIYGHLTIKTAVPIGVRARLEVTDSSANLDLLDPLVG